MNQAAVAHLRRHTVCKLMPPIPQHVFEWIYFVWLLSAKSWILKLGVPHFAPHLRGSTSFTLWRISPPFLGKPASCVGGQGQYLWTLSFTKHTKTYTVHVFLAAVGLSLVASPCGTSFSYRVNSVILCFFVISTPLYKVSRKTLGTMTSIKRGPSSPRGSVGRKYKQNWIGSKYLLTGVSEHRKILTDQPACYACWENKIQLKRICCKTVANLQRSNGLTAWFMSAAWRTARTRCWKLQCFSARIPQVDLEGLHN